MALGFGARADGVTVDDGYMAIVQNTDPYTYLAGRPLSRAPEATLDRGLAAQGWTTSPTGHTPVHRLRQRNNGLDASDGRCGGLRGLHRRGEADTRRGAGGQGR